MATLAMARLKIHTDLLYKCRFIKSDNPPRRVNKYSPGCDFMVILSRAESCVINLPSPRAKIGPAPLIASYRTSVLRSLFRFWAPGPHLIDGRSFAEMPKCRAAFSSALCSRINHIVWCVRACNFHLIFS